MTPLFGLTEAEFAKLTRANGNLPGTTEAGTVANANASKKAEDPQKHITQLGDPFTKARKSRKAPAKDFDPDYDVSDSSVCSDTELSIDNQTPRALRRPLGQEGIESRRHSTATDLSVAKVDKWMKRTSTYMEKETQTQSMVLVEDMGVQTDCTVLVEDMGVQTESTVLVKDMGVQTEVVPVKMEAPTFRQSRGYLLMSSFIHLLMLFFYLGMCYLAWASWAATTAERDLWTRANSAVTHGHLLFENGSNYPPSAIDPIFYRKM